METLEKLTNKELKARINESEQYLEVCAVSKRDLLFNAELWREAERRGLELKKTYV